MIRRTVIAGGSIAALVLGVGATPAFASSAGKPVTAVTHTHHHADTTTASLTGCLVASDSGPVWAYDNLSFRFRVTPEAHAGTYTVTITADGSFGSFANRFTGACTAQRGAVHGSLNYVVSSAAGPDIRDLPPQEPGTVSQGTMLKTLFQTTVTIVGGGSYRYIYTLVTGSKFVTAS